MFEHCLLSRCCGFRCPGTGWVGWQLSDQALRHQMSLKRRVACSLVYMASSSAEDGELEVRVTNLLTSAEVCRTRLAKDATVLEFRRSLSAKTGTPSLLYDILINSELVADSDLLSHFLEEPSTQDVLTIQVVLKDQEDFLKDIRAVRQDLRQYGELKCLGFVADMHKAIDAVAAPDVLLS
eukprot:TRINITY_DN24109_c0_g1_i1.p2 TRINITY_DN24109_c0_g1~~TRINITY_DN24109_c0_g1_i1.p2  ORF type:complete len:181 (+),score=30.15 TRINITY_DN24109_c0_g1_i1:59-601(+)